MLTEKTSCWYTTIKPANYALPAFLYQRLTAMTRMFQSARGHNSQEKNKNRGLYQQLLFLTGGIFFTVRTE